MRFYLAAMLLASMPWVGMAYTLYLDHQDAGEGHHERNLG
jgi:hypothetical protein